MALRVPIPDSYTEYTYYVWTWEKNRASEKKTLVGNYLKFDRATDTLQAIRYNEQDDWREGIITNSGFSKSSRPDCSLYMSFMLSATPELFADFFLDIYQPPVPADAPQWITDYLRFIHNRLPIVHSQEGLPAWQFNNDNKITLYAMPNGQTPVVQFYNMEIEDFNDMFYMGPNGRFSTYSTSCPYSAYLYRDENGHVLLETHGEVLEHWEIMSPTGWDNLFIAGGFEYDNPTSMVCNGHFATFDDHTVAAEWLSQKKAEAFSENGIGKLTLLEGTTYTLSSPPSGRIGNTGNALYWDALEKELIAALCDFAKNSSQENIAPQSE